VNNNTGDVINLCPFSKVIAARIATCPHARQVDRCSAKMTCLAADNWLPICDTLDEQLKTNARFIVHLATDEAQMTHQQSLKIRAGGIIGIHRILNLEDTETQIPSMIAQLKKRYHRLEDFPYEKIINDIKSFSVRPKRTRRS
jgi:hypothetical protein